MNSKKSPTTQVLSRTAYGGGNLRSYTNGGSLRTTARTRPATSGGSQRQAVYRASGFVDELDSFYTKAITSPPPPLAHLQPYVADGSDEEEPEIKPPNISSSSHERDEIADIIKDMSNTPAKNTMWLFLRIGASTKKVRWDGQQVTNAWLANQFVNKFDVEGVPTTVYIRDPKRGVFYELEDMGDVQDGSVLEWHTAPKTNSQNSQMEELADMVKALADTISQLPETLQKQLEQTTHHQLPPDTLHRSASVPTTQSIDHLARIQKLERDLSIERQARRELHEQNSRERTELLADLSKMQQDVAQHPNVLRVRVEEGLSKLKLDYNSLHNRLAEVDSMIQEMRTDVTRRGAMPTQQLMQRSHRELEEILQGADDLQRFIDGSDWKQTWAKELQNIVKEQDLVKEAQQHLSILVEDAQHSDKVYRALDKFIDCKLLERTREDYVPAAATKFLDVVSPDQVREAKQDFLLQITCVDIDHTRRLEALEAAEKLRQKVLASKVNEFDEELVDFVQNSKLRKTGGTEELEKRREAKQAEVMKDMLRSVEEAEAARRAKIAQRKAKKKDAAT